MFVKQIDMIEALRLAAVGQEINIMAPNTSEPKRWADYSPDTLQNLLEGCLFFRNEPAMDNFELERMMRGAPPPLTKIKADPGIPAWRIGPQWTVIPNGPRG